LSNLCRSPALFRDVDLSEIAALARIPSSFLAPIQHLSLRATASPTSAIRSFLDRPDVFASLTGLDLSFCATVDEVLFDALGEVLRHQLRTLRLRGCRRIRDGDWLAELVPHLEVLDLSWSGLRTLPLLEGKSTPSYLVEASMDVDLADLSDDGTLVGSDDTLVDDEVDVAPAWSKLRSLDLGACSYLDPASLSHFLSHLPPSLSHLSLAHLGPHTLDLDHLLLSALANDCALALDLRHCDGVTLVDVRALERRRVKVRHTAVLESDCLAGYRRFVDLVVHGNSV
jgi:hypothetical protein